MVELNKIYNEDCLNFLKRIPDNFVDLIVTDPPYNVSQKSDLKFNDRIIKKNFGDWDFNFDPLPVLAEFKRVLKPNGQIYVFCGNSLIPVYMQEFMKNWFFRNLIVWSKTNPAPRLNKSNFDFANEYIVYAVNEKVKCNTFTFNSKSHKEMCNFIVTSALQGKERIKDSEGKSAHPTQKPLSVINHLIEISSRKGDLVLDCFMGSGTTAVACKELERKFIGCELDKKYWNISNQRINN